MPAVPYYRDKASQNDRCVQAAGLFGADEEGRAADVETSGEERDGGVGRLQNGATAPSKQNNAATIRERRSGKAPPTI